MALITSESDDADLSKDGSFKNSQSTIKQPKTALDIIESISIINQNDDMVARSIYPMLERLQKLASSTMENVTSFHQAQQQMLYLSSTVKQQEERIHELKTAFELIEVERNESICMRVELQMLRESSAKLRSDQERLRFHTIGHPIPFPVIFIVILKSFAERFRSVGSPLSPTF